MTEILAALDALKHGRTFTGNPSTLKLAEFLRQANERFEQALDNAEHAGDDIARMVARAGMSEVSRAISTHGSYEPGNARERAVNFCVSRVRDNLEYFKKQEAKTKTA